MAKPSEEDRIRQLLRVARLFYEEHRSKTDIGHEIRASTTHVARLLEKAHEEGIVRVVFSPPNLTELALKLQERYPCLNQVLVISSDDNPSFTRRMLGQVTAAYFDQIVTAGMKVAISGGKTLYSMVESLSETDREIHIYPTAIIGRSGQVTHIDPIVLATLLWARSGRSSGHLHYFTVTPSKEGTDRKNLREEYRSVLAALPPARQVFEAMLSADAIFASLGHIETDLGAEPSLFDEAGVAVDQLRNEGAIGDINYCPFDKHGHSRDEWDVFLTIGVERLRAISRDKSKKVVVVVGNNKLPSLRAALQGKLFNVLITEEYAADTLLKQTT